MTGHTDFSGLSGSETVVNVMSIAGSGMPLGALSSVTVIW